MSYRTGTGIIIVIVRSDLSEEGTRQWLWLWDTWISVICRVRVNTVLTSNTLRINGELDSGDGGGGGGTLVDAETLS